MSWFPAPETIHATIFTRMPDKFRKLQRCDWADANKAGQPVDSFLEGPSFDRAGNLYVTDIPFGRIFRISPAGEWTLVTQYDGWPNGLKIDAKGRCIITDYRRGLMTLDPGTGPSTCKVEPLYTHIRSESFKGVNDLVIARNGDIYFTDQGQTGMQDATGRVYRLTADGRLERLLDTCPSPNGIALDTDERHLFVALTRACQVWRAPITRDGIIGKCNVFQHMPGGTSGPDGMAVDADDGLAVANPGHGCVWLLDKRGVPRHRVQCAAGHSITNVAFHPTARNELYITDSESGEVLKATVPVKGHHLASHA